MLKFFKNHFKLQEEKRKEEEARQDALRKSLIKHATDQIVADIDKEIIQDLLRHAHYMQYLTAAEKFDQDSDQAIVWQKMLSQVIKLVNKKRFTQPEEGPYPPPGVVIAVNSGQHNRLEIIVRTIFAEFSVLYNEENNVPMCVILGKPARSYLFDNDHELQLIVKKDICDPEFGPEWIIQQVEKYDASNYRLGTYNWVSPIQPRA